MQKLPCILTTRKILNSLSRLYWNLDHTTTRKSLNYLPRLGWDFDHTFHEIFRYLYLLMKWKTLYCQPPYSITFMFTIFNSRLIHPCSVLPTRIVDTSSCTHPAVGSSQVPTLTPPPRTTPLQNRSRPSDARPPLLQSLKRGRPFRRWDNRVKV